MKHLSIDLETFSDVDISKAGLFKYAQSPAFEILLLAYSLDGEPVKVIDLTEDVIPEEFLSLLLDGDCIKHAYNAQFEWYCLSRYLNIPPECWIDQWRCTMLHGMYLGFPAGLEACGKALGLPEDKQKLSTGKALIRYFCKPCPATKTNGGRTRNRPKDDPDKWKLFKEYNAQDVVTESTIEDMLSVYPVPEYVQRQWQTDMRINLRGVAADMDLVAAAQALDASTRDLYIEEAKQLTQLQNPNSVAQMAAWLGEQTGEDVPNLTKATVSQMLSSELPAGTARRVLELRQELGKTSNKKWSAFTEAACSDGRVRGLLQFYGANRSGRWAGRIIQPQNLPRTYISGELLPLARELTKKQDSEALRWIFGSIPDTLSQLIRTGFVASPGNLLLDADFSAIEARVIAWLAGEEWVLQVFRTHGKIYEATASQMFGIPLEKIKKGRPEYSYRQKGKVATLALGYQGGVGAMRQMDSGHELDSLSDDEVQGLVNLWRNANPNIVNLWRTMEDAAVACITESRPTLLPHGVIVERKATVTGLEFMAVRLPSGRRLYYPFPKITENRFGRRAISYMGQNQTTKKWERIESYGGKLTENLVQATARDCLAEAIERLEAAGYPVVFHIHDEIVVDAPPGKQDLEQMEALMAQVPKWAEGLPLNADGWTNEFFKKD